MKPHPVLLRWMAALLLAAGMPAQSPGEDTEGLDEATRQLLRQTRQVRIEVRQDFGDAEGVSLPLARLTGEILGLGGWSAAETADVVVTVTAQGEALAGQYEISGQDLQGEHFTGATLSGTIALAVLGRVVLERDFHGKVNRPWQISRPHRQPRDAPFEGTLPGFCAGVFRLVAEVQSLDPVIAGVTSHVGSRLGALQALIDVGDARAVPAVIALLPDENSEIRSMAARALGAIGDGQALPALIEALNEGEAAAHDRYVATNHSSVLDRMVALDYGLHPCETDEDRRDWAHEIENLSDFDARHAILWAAYQVRAPDKQAQLARALRDDRSVMRRAGAANLLGLLEDPAAVEPLLAAMHDRWFLVRAAAATALGRLGDPRALPALAVAESSGNAYERSCAEIAAGRIGEGRWQSYLQAGGINTKADSSDALPLEFLLRALEDNDPLIRAQAVAKAQPLLNTNDEVRAAVVRRLRDPAAAVRADAAFDLSFREDRGLADVMLELLRDPNERVHISAARYFETNPDRRATPGLIALLGSEDADMREAVVGALAKTKDPRAVEALGRMMDDNHSQVQEAVADALGEIGDERARPALQHMAADGLTPEVQEAALKALGRLGAGQDAAALVAELQRARPRLREALASAIGRTNDLSVVDDLIALLPEHEAKEEADDGTPRDELIGLSLPEAARQALLELTGQAHETAAEWREWWRENGARLQAEAKAGE